MKATVEKKSAGRRSGRPSHSRPGRARVPPVPDLRHPARGFPRARCADCGQDFPVAFSCKGRGASSRSRASRGAGAAVGFVVAEAAAVLPPSPRPPGQPGAADFPRRGRSGVALLQSRRPERGEIRCGDVRPPLRMRPTAPQPRPSFLAIRRIRGRSRGAAERRSGFPVGTFASYWVTGVGAGEGRSIRRRTRVVQPRNSKHNQTVIRMIPIRQKSLAFFFMVRSA